MVLLWSNRVGQTPAVLRCWAWLGESDGGAAPDCGRVYAVMTGYFGLPMGVHDTLCVITAATDMTRVHRAESLDIENRYYGKHEIIKEARPPCRGNVDHGDGALRLGLR
jgi:hypothetical protein